MSPPGVTADSLHHADPFKPIFSLNPPNSSSSFTGLGRAQTRSKPRLVKQRRYSKSRPSLPSDAGLSGFRSVYSSNVDSLSFCNSNSSPFCDAGGFAFGGLDSSIDDKVNVDCSISDHCFVFGGQNVSSVNNVSVGKAEELSSNRVKVVNGEADSVGFSFSSTLGVGNGTGVGNLEELKTMNIKKNQTVNVGGVTVAGQHDACRGVSSVGSVSFVFKSDKGESKTLGREEFCSSGVECKNGEVGGVGFSFSARDQGVDCDSKGVENGLEVGISEELKNLNIDKNETYSRGGETLEGRKDGRVGVSNSGNGFFVFESEGGESVTLGSEEKVDHSNGNDECVSGGESGGVKSHFVDEDVFVFGRTGNCRTAGDFISECFFTNFGGSRVKQDVGLSSFSFSTAGENVGKGKPEGCSVFGEWKTDCTDATKRKESMASAPDFNGPLLFSANVHGEWERKPASRVKSRGLRGKHSKKGRGKAKHFNPSPQQPIEKPLSASSVTQDKEVAECYSPMDFSPYEETTANNDAPLDGQQITGQSEVTSGTDVFSNGQPGVVLTSYREDATISDPPTSFSKSLNKNDGEKTRSELNVSDKDEEKFAFTASDFTLNHDSSVKRHPKKKYRLKTAPVAGRTTRIAPVAGRTSRIAPVAGTPLSGKLNSLTTNPSVSASKHATEEDGKHGCESAFTAEEKSCNKWKRRGNEAYGNGDFSKAEDFYTWGVNCIPLGYDPTITFSPLVHCYSNRAAARMSLGKMREAIQDCLMAAKLDPTFHKAHMRAANCYLQLGELEDAMECFGKIVDSSIAVCLDRQLIISASEGIKKSQKVIDCINQAAKLLQHKTSEAAANALVLITEALSLSVHSEKLLEMKAEAQCMLRKHDEAITLCQKTLDFAKKNFPDSSCLNIHLWRHHILCKCQFHLGKLEVALELIEKEVSEDKSQDSSNPLAYTIRELLKEKSAGNDSFQSGKHVEAIEHYTTAIFSSLESRPFAAVCFCNRAAAHQALGHIADAISDCSRAIALDENYAKAVSRRATLHEMIRDYKQAAGDLQRLVYLLEKHSKEKSKQSGSENTAKELRKIKHRLSAMEEEAKKDIPMDLYLILGVNKSDSASEIKKAYRKAALRHHPDKVGQALVRNDVGDEGRLWMDIAELVHMDSERVFKMIGEAYAVLSDPTKREEYDQEEDMRKALKESSSNIRSSSRRHSEYYQGYPFERSSNRRSYWQDGYRYSYSHNRW